MRIKQCAALFTPRRGCWNFRNVSAGISLTKRAGICPRPLSRDCKRGQNWCRRVDFVNFKQRTSGKFKPRASPFAVVPDVAGLPIAQCPAPNQESSGHEEQGLAQWIKLNLAGRGDQGML